MNTPQYDSDSSSANTFETFSDSDQGCESNKTKPHCSKTDTSRESGGKSNEALLNKVLSETLARTHSDPELMLDSLRRWRTGIQSDVLDESTCQKMISQVLDFRLGQSAKELNDQLRREVSTVLWENSESRSRIERLWNSITVV